jgi:hypothetical protein
MARKLDCLVSYFGFAEDERAGMRRHFSYRIQARPGPIAGAGVAVITKLTGPEEAEGDTAAEKFHVVETGGPAAAIGAAVRYLDAYHRSDHLWKIQSDVRRLGEDPATEGAPTRTIPFRAYPPVGDFARKG